MFKLLCGNIILDLISILGVSGLIFSTNQSLSKLSKQRPGTVFGYYAKMKIYSSLIEISLGTENNTPILNGVEQNNLDKSSDSYKPDQKK